MDLLAGAQPSVPATALPRPNTHHKATHLAGAGPPPLAAVTVGVRETCSAHTSAGTGNDHGVDVAVPDQVHLSSQAHFQALSQLAALADNLQAVQGRVSSLGLSPISLVNDRDSSEDVVGRQHEGTEGNTAREAITATEMEGSGNTRRGRVSSENIQRLLENVSAAVAGIENLRLLLNSGI